MMDLTTNNNQNGYVDEKGTAWLNAEYVARGWGFTQQKNNIEYIRWETINAYLNEFGFSQQVGKSDFLPENIVYRLGFKAKNEKAIEFQIKLSEEILPSIRKTGSYSVNQQQPSYQIVDEIERAKRWIEEAQEKKQLTETNQRLEQELAEEKEFKQVVFEKEECVSYSDAYKIIASELNHIGRNNFIQALRDKNIISEYNIPRDYYINKGFFKIKKVIIVKTDGDTKERKQGVVTPKGIDWLLQYFKKRVLK